MTNQGSLFAPSADAPAVGSLLPYFGGKRTLAPRIVAELGRHRSYYEPFMGSLAVLLAKPKCAMEIAGDLWGDATNLAKVIQHAAAGAALYRKLRRTLLCEQLFHEALDRATARGDAAAGEPDVERAYDTFLIAWMGRNGVTGTSASNETFCIRYTGGGGSPGKRFASAVDSIPAFARRLREVMIVQKCGIEICEKIEDAPGVAIYADPPYLVKGAKYRHDFGDADHERLAAALRRFKRTRVVVSYYAHPRLAELYPGWTQVGCTLTKSLVNQGMRDGGGAVKAPEVLLVNGLANTAMLGEWQ